MLKNELLWHLQGGSNLHFFDGFWHPGSKWLQVVPKMPPRRSPGGPRGAQSHPEHHFLMILARFWEDFEVILPTLGWSREYPKPKTSNITSKTLHPKLSAPNPTPKLQKGQYQNSGTIPPVPKPQKSISRIWAAFPLLLKSARVHVDIIFCQSSMKADPLAQQPTVQGKTRKPDLKPKT